MTTLQINNEVVKSKVAERTTNLLREFIFGLVNDSLTAHYGSNYSMRCFQSSILIKSFLDDIGIKSRIVLGATCFPKVVGMHPYQISWNGFWDNDHHIWLVTEFCEIVDLTISQLHMHPVDYNSNSHPIPPIWWYPGDMLPSIFKYLPDKSMPKLEDAAQKDLNELKLKFANLHSEALQYETYANRNPLNSILHDMSVFSELYNNKNHWAIGCFIAQEIDLQLPEWISNKEKELLAPYS